MQRQTLAVVVSMMLVLAARGATQAAAQDRWPRSQRGRGEIAGDLLDSTSQGGQATLLVSPSGESMLIDAASPHARRPPYCRGGGDRRRETDRLFRDTHFHLESLGSIPDLVTMLPIRNFVDSGTIAETGKQSSPRSRRMRATARRAGNLVVKPANRADYWHRGEGGDAPAARRSRRRCRGGAATRSAARSIRRRSTPPRRPSSVGLVVSFGQSG